MSGPWMSVEPIDGRMSVLTVGPVKFRDTHERIAEMDSSPP